MISKALFKQSCKANWIKWTAVTISTCVMLAIVIIVLGNLGINDIRDSLKDVFTQADQESYLKENVVNSYELYLTSVDASNTVILSVNQMFDEYDQAKQDFETEYGIKPEGEQLQQIKITIANATVQQMGQFLNSSGSLSEDDVKNLIVMQLTSYDNNPEETKTNFIGQIKMALPSILPQQIADSAKQEEIANGATEAEAEEKSQQALDIATDAVNDYITTSNSVNFVYSRDIFTNNARNYINQMMYDSTYQLSIDEEMSESEAKQYATSVKVIANTASTTYELWINEYKQQGIEDVSEQKAMAKVEACKSISDQIPQKVAEALEELGDMDMYGLIIGSIFYRIAGLLLPMVFVIMTANGLLAGQVDSGSMAYVLSTPTKRRTVTVTQLAYLLFSLFAMFALLTVVSVIAVWVSGGNSFAINYAEILLFNLGAFLTMFAFAGFCFMCSALFNRTKYSLSIGGGLTIFSLVCTILGLFGSTVVPSAMRISAMNFFNYLSIITLFDTTNILNGSLSFLWQFGILLAIGVVSIIIGVFRFDKKDLPL